MAADVNTGAQSINTRYHSQYPRMQAEVSSNFFQQKVTVLVSDWLPAVINKSTDARKLTSESRNKKIRSKFVILFFINGVPGT